MKNQKSLGVNAILNVIRTILSLVAPLITYPYVSRVLGAENLGSVNYTNSIIQYLVLLSGLGISTYGIREGSKKRDNKAEVSKFISDCFTINIIFTVLAYAIFLIVLYFFGSEKNYFSLFVVQSFLIIFSTIGIEWINTVFEDYYYITIRTIIVQIVSIALTFLLIHKREDYLLYAVVTVMGTGIVSVLNWVHYRNSISIRIERHPNFKLHFKSITVFFANKLAVTLYVSADTTMLGAMVGNYSVGLYSVSVKIYTIIKNLLAAMYAVFLPRLSYIEGRKDRVSFKSLYSNLMSIMTLIIFPASVGLLCLSKNIIVLLFGIEYMDSYFSLVILSIAIIFAIYGGLVAAVYDVVMGLEKIALQSTIIAASLNIVINMITLPIYRQNGAALTTLLAEFVTFAYCLFRSKDIFNCVDLKMVCKSIFHAIIGCTEISLIVWIVNAHTNSNILICIISFVMSASLYLLTLIILKNKHIIEGINMIRNKLHRHNGD